MELTDFDALKNGFAFTNGFSTTVISGISLGGLCAGMAFAALDYFNARRRVPTHASADYAQSVPPTGSRLQRFIYTRHLNAYGFEPSNLLLLASGDPAPSPTADLLSLQNGTRFLGAVAGSPTAADLAAEVSKLRAALLAARPVPLGMVAATGALDSHVVVAHGFDESVPGQFMVFVYDPNHPGRPCTLRVDSASLTCVEELGDGSTKNWKSFLVMHYAAVPPTYLDLTLSAGLTSALDPSEGRRAFAFSFSLTNEGETTAHATALSIELDEPLQIDFNLPVEIGGSAAPGASLACSISCNFPEALAGQTVTIRPAVTNAFGATTLTQTGSALGVSQAQTITIPLEFD